jgi:hypothetical protein
MQVRDFGNSMRARDVRAIAFCVATTLAMFVLVLLFSRNYIAAVAATIGWAAFVLTRPRMQRVIRRLQGKPDWSGYFKND